MRRLLFGALGLAGPSISFSEPPPYNEKIRGVYENKIRQNALPEKVFEVFATIKEGKSFYMTPGDFFKSIIPYNYAPNRGGDLLETHESLILRMADANGDGRISFDEYMFFSVLLLTPTHYIKALLKQCGGEVDQAGFVQLMKEAKAMNLKGQRITEAKGMIDPRGTCQSDEGFINCCISLYRGFFEHHERISLSDFIDVKELIIEEILFYEFHSFEVQDNCISSEDFAKSIICCMRTAKVEPYLKRIENQSFEGKIAYDEFLAFMATIHNVERFENKLVESMYEGHKSLSREEFKAVLNDLCDCTQFCSKYQLRITEQQLNVFFDLLDLDDSGTLEFTELHDVLAGRVSYGTEQPVGFDISTVLNPIKFNINQLLRHFGYRKYFNVYNSNTKLVNTPETEESASK